MLAKEKEEGEGGKEGERGGGEREKGRGKRVESAGERENMMEKYRERERDRI